ncbi:MULTISPECIES: hypothetical protein [Burkholderia]|uniref:hypothetical protein n=1 Tax=Burkholderia TaxID=32008 RepID=UPI000841A7C2|nr:MULTISPECIES: hypothetical protein [unclassified Burkholderia]AOK28872.1 hypothetical protein AQ611_04945 [Burkholderia sp. Bp7605]
MLTIRDLQNLITEIRNVLPDAVISGGAPRDVYFDKPVKDIDVMTSRIGHYCGGDADVLTSLARAVGGKFHYAGPQDPSGDAQFEYEIEMPNGIPRLNVISLENFEITDPIENLFDFDFGLSQIAVLPSGVLMTPAFLHDQELLHITYMGDNDKASWRIDSSAKRLKRLKEKYPTWFFRNCAGLEARAV